MKLRKPWRVLLWSLLLYAALFLSIYGCAGKPGVLGGAGCIVTVAVGASPFIGFSMFDRMQPDDAGYSGEGDSAFDQFLWYGVLGVMIAAFVAQTMAAAAMLDAIARRIARVRGADALMEPIHRGT